MAPVLQIIADANLPYAREIFAPFGNVTIVPTGTVSPSILRSADALIVRSETPVDSSLLDGSSVKFVGTATIGIDHVDIAYLSTRKIIFASAPGSNANSVAGYVATALLEAEARFGWTLRGKSLGVIGVGNVGRKVVRVAEAFGMKVLRNDPPLARREGDSSYVSIEEALACDAVTLHVPLERGGTDPTYHLIGDREFGMMKPESVFLNTSRGAVVETAAMVRALRSKCVRAAVIDVWENEPNIDVDLLTEVFLATPHIAGYSLDGKVAAVTMMAEALRAAFGLDHIAIPRPELPHPTTPECVLEPERMGVQECLRRAVALCYEIHRDDLALRPGIHLPSTERRELFRRLRKEYPIRREFRAATIHVPARETSLIENLTALGFTVRI